MSVYISARLPLSDVLAVGKNWSKEKLSTKLEEGTAILKQVYR
jgi:hypothetical protein